MGHCVDQEIAQSQRGPDLETEATPQAHYIKWAKIFGIPDPCGYYEGFIRIVFFYINSLSAKSVLAGEKLVATYSISM